MTQVVVIGEGDTTFTAACDACGSTFAGRLDDDLAEGIFLCRAGHAVRIVRVEPPAGESAAATAA